MFEGVGGAACLRWCVPVSEHAVSSHASVWGYVLDLAYFSVCLCVPVRVSGGRRWLCVTEYACEYFHREQVCPVVCVRLDRWGVSL